MGGGTTAAVAPLARACGDSWGKLPHLFLMGLHLSPARVGTVTSQKGFTVEPLPLARPRGDNTINGRLAVCGKSPSPGERVCVKP